MITGDELIVVDDGSEDHTPAVLQKYADLIRVIKAEHGGAGKARNIGIAHANNNLVAFLDSDDIWLPGKLKIQRSFMEQKPDILFCFTNFEVQFQDGLVRPSYLELWHRDHATWEQAFGHGLRYSSIATLPDGISDFKVYKGDLYRLQLTGFYILTDTLVVRRQEAGDSLHFAEDLKTYEDLECFYRISRKGKGAFLNLDTARQHDHPNNRLSQLTSLEKINARLILLNRIWGNDTEFLKQQSHLYQMVLDETLCQKAGLSISMGLNSEARRSLTEMSSPPLFLRFITFLPSPLILLGLKIRRFMRRIY